MPAQLRFRRVMKWPLSDRTASHSGPHEIPQYLAEIHRTAMWCGGAGRALSERLEVEQIHREWYFHKNTVSDRSTLHQKKRQGEQLVHSIWSFAKEEISSDAVNADRNFAVIVIHLNTDILGKICRNPGARVPLIPCHETEDYQVLPLFFISVVRPLQNVEKLC